MSQWAHEIGLFVFALIGILFSAAVASALADKAGATMIRVVDHYWMRRRQYVEWVTETDKHGFDSIQ